MVWLGVMEGWSEKKNVPVKLPSGPKGLGAVSCAGISHVWSEMVGFLREAHAALYCRKSQQVSRPFPRLYKVSERYMECDRVLENPFTHQCLPRCCA